MKMVENWKEIPIFINNFNNLNRGFKLLINWLFESNCKNITIIDNNSTWKPLLEYYKSLDVNILFVGKNLGCEALWKLGLHNKYEKFILTDPDIVPDKNCPKDLIRKMIEISNRYNPSKVGPSIRIDNLPDNYRLKQLMLDSEGKYWTNRIDKECWRADIDTTFALYNRGWGRFPPVAHIRLDFPYIIEHIPWYDNSNEANEERDYYKNSVIQGMSHSE